MPDLPMRRAEDGSLEVFENGKVRPATAKEARAFVRHEGSRIEPSPRDTSFSRRAALGLGNILTQGPGLGTGGQFAAFEKDPEAFKYIVARTMSNTISSDPALMAGFMRNTLKMKDVSVRNGQIFVGGSPIDPERFVGIADTVMDLSSDLLDDIAFGFAIPGGVGFRTLVTRAISLELTRQLVGDVAGLGPENLGLGRATVTGVSVGTFGKALKVLGVGRQKAAQAVSNFIKKPGVRRVASSLMARLANIPSGRGIDAGKAFAFRVKNRGDFPTMQNIADRMKPLLSRRRVDREANIPEFATQRAIVDANASAPTDLSGTFDTLLLHSRGASTSDSGRAAISRVGEQAFRRILESVDALLGTSNVKSAGTKAAFMSMFKRGQWDRPMAPSVTTPRPFGAPAPVFGQNVERISVRELMSAVPARTAENVKRLIDDDASYALPGMVETAMPGRVAQAAVAARTSAKESLEAALPPEYAQVNAKITEKLASIDEMINLLGKDVAKTGPEKMRSFIINRGGEEEMRRVRNFDELFDTNFADDMFKAGVGQMVKGEGGQLEAIPAFTATGSFRGPAAGAAVAGFTLGPFLPPGFREAAIGSAGLAGLFALASPKQVGRTAQLGLAAEPAIHRGLEGVGSAGVKTLSAIDESQVGSALARLMGLDASTALTRPSPNLPAEVLDAQALAGQPSVSLEALRGAARTEPQADEFLRRLAAQSDLFAPVP